jgi:hypothetical protein
MERDRVTETGSWFSVFRWASLAPWPTGPSFPAMIVALSAARHAASLRHQRMYCTWQMHRIHVEIIFFFFYWERDCIGIRWREQVWCIITELANSRTRSLLPRSPRSTNGHRKTTARFSYSNLFILFLDIDSATSSMSSIRCMPSSACALEAILHMSKKGMLSLSC